MASKIDAQPRKGSGQTNPMGEIPFGIAVPEKPCPRAGLLLILEVTKTLNGEVTARWAYIPKARTRHPAG